MNKFITLVILASSSLASSVALGDNSGQRPGPSAWVTARNQPQYNSLRAQSSQLGARLNSYNTRAMTPASTPAAYNALKSEQRTLAAQVQSYNSTVQQFAQRNPVSPYNTPAATAARTAQAQQNKFIMNLVASRARR
ncbi:MAG: hypothetical protein ABI321_00635 [Polyangia bacterium]